MKTKRMKDAWKIEWLFGPLPDDPSACAVIEACRKIYHLNLEMKKL